MGLTELQPRNAALRLHVDDDVAVARVALADLGFSSPCEVRDLWQHQNLGVVGDLFESRLPEHGAGLYLVSPQPVKTSR